MLALGPSPAHSPGIVIDRKHGASAVNIQDELFSEIGAQHSARLRGSKRRGSFGTFLVASGIPDARRKTNVVEARIGRTFHNLINFGSGDGFRGVGHGWHRASPS